MGNYKTVFSKIKRAVLAFIKDASTLIAKLRTNFTGVVGLDFKTDAIITKASSTLPLNTALILVNNKGYPIYHDKLEEYAWNDVTTKLQDFQYSNQGKEVSHRISGFSKF